ncbi:MAG: hypothetical protein KME60_15280 [Cyanomargarita calcarea GSE-NOS-MK-12-04C]|jgi:hypothetical protein|uniref:Uncharacterized protein n=1 Tax=Cyanomargarita calcarea GSE-NOS-MK-12-04C TaxID=2839659 RepID=A0A951UVB1_9CYAN|nr:hypothetical protein [Cyanomargarita calcarea GSE-NOS-MK-12-04C]
MKKLPLLLIAFSLLMAQPAIAEKIVESDREFAWKEVPGTLQSSEPGNPKAEQLPWYLNAKNVTRQGDTIVFETVSPEAEYVKFEGNCKTQQLRVQYLGEFQSETKVAYEPAPDFWSSDKATGVQQKLLNSACSLN